MTIKPTQQNEHYSPSVDEYDAVLTDGPCAGQTIKARAIKNTPQDGLRIPLPARPLRASMQVSGSEAPPSRPSYDVAVYRVGPRQYAYGHLVSAKYEFVRMES